MCGRLFFSLSLVGIDVNYEHTEIPGNTGVVAGYARLAFIPGIPDELLAISSSVD